MSSLPTDLTPDILACLPVKDLLRFRCVCSSWHSLIDSPYFAKFHLSRSQKTRSNLFILDNKGKGKFKSLGFDSLDKAPEIPQLPPIRLSLILVEIAGLCNGVVALYNPYGGEDVSLLWNPSTRKLRELPSSKITAENPGFYRERVAYGFGYDSVMDDYKLLLIKKFENRSLPSFFKADVFSLKMDNWREIDCPFAIDIPVMHTRSEALVNNALHWVSYSQPPDIMVVGFDLAKDEFYLVPNYPDCGFAMFHHVGVLGGCLSMASNCFGLPASLHVWVMKDYGVKKSWSKLLFLTLNPPDNARRYSPFAIPIAYSRDHRRILLDYVDGRLSWYDLTRKTVHFVNELDNGHNCFRPAILCTESLITLDSRKDNNNPW